MSWFFGTERNSQFINEHKKLFFIKQKGLLLGVEDTIDVKQ